METNGKTKRVRLLNIDTPEIGHDGKPSECLAEDAKSYLQGLLPVGTEVRLEHDVEKQDKYGRELAGVFVSGELINAKVAGAGLAKAIIVGKNRKFFPEVKAEEDKAAGRSEGIFGVGPECFILGNQYAQTSDTYDSQVAETQEILEQSLGDSDPEYIVRHRHDLEKTRAALIAFSTSENASRFYKEHFSGSFNQEVSSKVSDLNEGITDLDKKRVEVERYQEEKRQRTAQEAESLRREAEEAAQAAERARIREAEAARAQQALSASSDNGAAAAPQAPAPIDTYTGCRAYGGNYALTSVDKKGRPYAKIDCSIKQQIG